MVESGSERVVAILEATVMGRITLLEYFAGELLHQQDVLAVEVSEQLSDEQLDALTRQVWRVARSMVRSHPAVEALALTRRHA